MSSQSDIPQRNNAVELCNPIDGYFSYRLLSTYLGSVWRHWLVKTNSCNQEEYNTGDRLDNIQQYLTVADGVIVGSSLKVNGKTWNPVDPTRVKAFMSKVNEIRVKTHSFS